MSNENLPLQSYCQTCPAVCGNQEVMDAVDKASTMARDFKNLDLSAELGNARKKCTNLKPLQDYVNAEQGIKPTEGWGTRIARAIFSTIAPID